MNDRLLKESDVMRIAFQLPYVVNSAFFDAVKALPSARPKEGKWIWNENGMDWGIGCWCCSECGMRNPYIGSGDNALLSNPHNWAGSNFCPNCGADMRGVDDGNK